MSVISTTGAEDYARTLERVGQPLLNVVAKAIAADDTSAMFDVSNWEGVAIRSPQLSSPPGWTFTFSWYNDAAGTIQLGQRMYRSGQGHPIGDSTINQGPFLQVVTHATSYAGSPAYSLLVVPRNGSGPSARNVVDGVLVNTTAAVGGLGTATIGTLRIATGNALWNAGSTVAANWGAALQTLDEAGVARTIAELYGIAGSKGASLRVLLPAYEVQVVVVNTDAGAATLRTSLVLEM